MNQSKLGKRFGGVAAFATAAWLAAQYPGRWERVTTPKPAR